MAYRDSTITHTQDGAGPPTFTYPTVAAHDVLILSVSVDGITTVTAPAGFTQIATVQCTADNQTQTVFRKADATGSESGSVNLTISPTLKASQVTCSSHSGRNNTTPETFVQTSVQSTAGNSPLSVALTAGTAATGDDLVWCAEIDQITDTDTWSFAAPSTFTQRQNGANGSWVSAALSTKDNVASGATGTITGVATRTAGVDQGGWTGVVIALAAGAGGASGSAAITEGADTFAGTGSVGVSGSAAITEGADTAAGVGSIGVSGSAAITEGADTFAGTGTAGAAGSAAITEPADVAAASGSVGVSGSAAITESADVVAGTGAVGVSGSAAITEAADTVSGTGSATNGVDGQAAIAEPADTVAATGSVGVSGAAAVIEAGDIVAGAGFAGDGSATGSNPGGGGGGNSAGWSGKFEFTRKPDAAELAAEALEQPEHVPRGTPPIGVLFPENTATILSDALSSRAKGSDENDDEEAMALIHAVLEEERVQVLDFLKKAGF